jgi:hypothetical protein
MVWSTNMPKLWSLPAMVPTSESCGRSTRGGFGADCGAFATVTWATAGGRGRREAENTGRSRVLDSVVSGIAHSGLALRAGVGGAGGVTVTGEEAVGCSRSGGAAKTSAGRGASASMSEMMPLFVEQIADVLAGQSHLIAVRIRTRHPAAGRHRRSL